MLEYESSPGEEVAMMKVRHGIDGVAVLEI
jgi:hypothetical protein